MQGNSQYGGYCLYLNSFPDMPWYPQLMKLKVYCVTTGEEVVKRFKIRDCDGDDLTCSEYYNQHFGDGEIVIREDNTEDQEISNFIKKIKIFDYTGKIIYEGNNYDYVNLSLKGLFFISSFNLVGDLIETKKVYL